MQIRNQGKVILWATAAAMALAGASGVAQMPPPQTRGGHFMGDFGPFEFSEKVVKRAPFSAQVVTEMNQTLSDGNQIHRTKTSTLYRDADGRTRREETMGPVAMWSGSEENARQIVLINDPVSGLHYILDPASHSARKMQIPQRRMRGNQSSAPSGSVQPPPPPEPGRFGREMAEAGATEAQESLGSQVIEGVQADGTRTTTTIPAGSVGNVKPIQIVTERWYSPALQMVVMSKRSDPRIGETVYRLTNINLAPPQATLFQVPADYTLREASRSHEFGMRPVPNPNE